MSYTGLLNKFCSIQELTKTQDSETGQMIDSWAVKYNNVKCRLDQPTGTEIAAQGSILSQATHVLFIGINYTLTAGENRIVFDGKNYNILLIKNASGHDHHLEILLRILQ